MDFWVFRESILYYLAAAECIQRCQRLQIPNLVFRSLNPRSSAMPNSDIANCYTKQTLKIVYEILEKLCASLHAP